MKNEDMKKRTIAKEHRRAADALLTTKGGKAKNLSLEEALLAQAGSLTLQVAQVVKLGAAHFRLA